MPPSRTRPAGAGAPPARQPAGGHSREAGCAGCLTDAEWLLVADLFEASARGRGRPAKYARRTMVDACCYVLRTGCPWSKLPKSFPPWQAVYKSLSRWSAQGKFDELHQRLHQYWRRRLTEHPTAEI